MEGVKDLVTRRWMRFTSIVTTSSNHDDHQQGRMAGACRGRCEPEHPRHLAPLFNRPCNVSLSTGGGGTVEKLTIFRHASVSSILLASLRPHKSSRRYCGGRHGVWHGDQHGAGHGGRHGGRQGDREGGRHGDWQQQKMADMELAMVADKVADIVADLELDRVAESPT